MTMIAEHTFHPTPVFFGRTSHSCVAPSAAVIARWSAGAAGAAAGGGDDRFAAGNLASWATNPDLSDAVVIGTNNLINLGLRHVLEEMDFDVAVLAPCSPAHDAFMVTAAEPRLVVIDSHDGRRDALLCTNLRRRFASCRLVLLSDDCSLENVACCFNAGADGVVGRSTPKAPMAEALVLIMMGEKYMPVAAYGGLDMLRPPRSTRHEQREQVIGCNLTERELEILAHLANGDPNKMIAWRLDITEATTKVHIKTILRKLRLKNRTQAAIWAVGQGLAPPAAEGSISERGSGRRKTEQPTGSA